MGLLRTAAIFTSGVLTASALAIVQPWGASAAPGDLDSTYVPIAPCRVIDTRPAPDTVGPRTAPLGPGETYPVQITGNEGDCVDIPADASAVALNVTVVGGTAASFLTLFPADLAAPPKAANLNWLPGAPATPNKVDVKLSPDGKVSFYNENGTVAVIADIAGYYTASSLVDLETRLAAVEASAATVDARIRDAQPSAVQANGASSVPITSDWTSVLSRSSSISRDGTVLAFASATAVEFEAGADVQCVITNDETSFTVNDNMRWEAAGVNDGDQGDASNLAGTQAFDVVGGTSETFRLMCRVLSDTNGAEIWSPRITMLFIRDR